MCIVRFNGYEQLEVINPGSVTYVKHTKYKHCGPQLTRRQTVDGLARRPAGEEPGEYRDAGG